MSSSTLRYPRDLSPNSQTDYIRFQFFKYQPPFQRGGQGAAGGGYYQGGEGNIGEQLGPNILLYMPQDVTTSMATTWGGKEITNAAAGALTAVGSVLTGRGDRLAQGVGDAFKSLGALPTTAGAQLVRAGLKATGAQSNLEMNDILGGVSGVILNPNMEMLFGGPQVRNIGFRFKMAARSEQEAKDMIRICRAFQYHAHAKFGGGSLGAKAILGGIATLGINAGNVAAEASGQAALDINQAQLDEDLDELTQVNNFISVPDLCLFKYMTGEKENQFINQYKACALTNVDVNFTPDGSYSTLIGGYPSAVELSITLVETKIIYQSEINPDLGVSN
tara:strand:- start:45 stop:1046 length:1002 start_codon:yes stop_codon:yes gene_type:complete